VERSTYRRVGEPWILGKSTAAADVASKRVVHVNAYNVALDDVRLVVP
jgi:hypothetical protein